MRRFILRYRGQGAQPGHEVQRIRSHQKIRILDDTPHMMLVEAPERSLKHLMASMPDWIMAPELTLSVTDPRPKLRSSERAG